MATYTLLRVAAETYAVPVGNTVEIASLGDLTAVPGSRKEILGVRNLRGQILPVIDLALVLGLSTPVPPKRLLVAEAAGVKACFAIEEVTDVTELPDPVQGAEQDFLLGTMVHDGEPLAVIDVPRLFRSLQQADR